MSECEPTLVLKKGTDDSIVVTFKKDDVAIDLTGSTVFFTAKKNISDSDTALTSIYKTVTVHVDADGNPSATSGITTIALSASDLNKAAGTYHWDLRLKDTAGKIVNSDMQTLKLESVVTERTS